MAEKVHISYGHLEILPERMQSYVEQHEMNHAEIERIVQARLAYLHWSNDHWANKVIVAGEDRFK